MMTMWRNRSTQQDALEPEGPTPLDGPSTSKRMNTRVMANQRLNLCTDDGGDASEVMYTALLPATRKYQVHLV